MKKSVLKEVDDLKTEWIYYGLKRVPSALLYNHDIEQKANDFFRRNNDRIRIDLIRLLEALPFSHKHLKPDWKDYYYNTKSSPLYLDWYTDYLYDLSEAITEYKAIQHVEPEIIREAKEHVLNSINDRGVPIENFKKTMTLKMVGIAKDMFVSSKHPVYCNLKCKKYFLDCKYIKSKSQEDCPKNSHIRELKREQKKRSTDGYIPEIAYLLAKFGILKIDYCEYRIDSCRESDCLTVKLKQCGQDVDEILKKSSIKGLYPHLEDRLGHMPEANCKNKKFQDNVDYYLICESCKYKNVFGDISKFIRDISKNPPENVAEPTFKKGIDLLKKLAFPLFNPCPRTTEQVSKIVSKQNRRWKLKVRISDYVNVYLYHQLKNNEERKKMVINELQKRFPSKSPNTIIQHLTRKTKKIKTSYKELIEAHPDDVSILPSMLRSLKKEIMEN